MKALRAQVAGDHIVIMVCNAAGEELPHVIACDKSDAYAALCAVIDAATGDAVPRARAGSRAPVVEPEIVETFEYENSEDRDVHETPENETWIGDAAAFLSDARAVIDTDERAGAAWGSFLGVLRDLSAQKGDS